MLLDIGLGIIGAIIFSNLNGVEISPSILVLSIIFSLLPDLDFIFKLIQRGSIKKVGHEHRDLFHYPLVFIPAGFIMMFIFSSNYAYLFATLVSAHFIHDSIGVGWGVLWLYPFSKKYYKFFSDKEGKYAWQPVASWTQREQQEAVNQFGDINWLKNIYLKPTVISVTELLAFVLALILLYALK